MVEHNITRLYTKFHIFYHAPIFSYELYKKLHMKTCSENQNWSKTFLYPAPLTHSCWQKGPRVSAQCSHADRGVHGVDRRVPRRWRDLPQRDPLSLVHTLMAMVEHEMHGNSHVGSHGSLAVLRRYDSDHRWGYRWREDHQRTPHIHANLTTTTVERIRVPRMLSHSHGGAALLGTAAWRSSGCYWP
jgi:hypothetical protein